MKLPIQILRISSWKKIAVSQSYKNKVGDIVLVCETEEKRNESENLVVTIVMNIPAEMCFYRNSWSPTRIQ